MSVIPIQHWPCARLPALLDISVASQEHTAWSLCAHIRLLCCSCRLVSSRLTSVWDDVYSLTSVLAPSVCNWQMQVCSYHASLAASGYKEQILTNAGEV